MKKWNLSIVYSSIFFLVANIAVAKDIHYFTEEAEVIIPESSQIKNDENVPVTSLIVTNPKKKLANGLPNGETPASFACVYGLTKPVPGCNKQTAKILPTGGWGAIALVDAFHNPNAEHDLNVFSRHFGLPECTIANGCFHLYFATGTNRCNTTTKPRREGWWDEQVLDIEMAHAMAPKAKIYLVEAETGSITDLLAAVDCASNLVAQAGGGFVSMSWSMKETPVDVKYNSHFKKPGVVYIGSSGDYGAPARYPSSSPFVISAGGTKIIRDKAGNLVDEHAWSRIEGTPPGEKSGSSGGPSLFQTRPAFQDIVQDVVGAQRGTPDIAFDADPKSGALIYSTYRGGWFVDGGTSLSAPALAGVLNSANHRVHDTQELLTYIYSFYPKRYHQYWHNIIKGHNGFPARDGYDFITGLGSPLGYAGK